MSRSRAALFASLMFCAGALLAGCAGATPEASSRDSTAPDEQPSSISAPAVPSASETEEEPAPESSSAPAQTSPAEPKSESESVEVVQGEEPSNQPTKEVTIPWSEVEENITMESCWIVLEGDVYDFSQVVQQHPFGAQLTGAVCGKDATELFEQNGNLDEIIERLEVFYLGPVA